MSKKTIITLGILIVLSFFAYTIFFKDKMRAEPDGLVNTTTGTSTAAEKQIGVEILSALAALEKLKNMDVEFFNGKIFDNLKRSDQKVPELPIGRKNPFAPIGAPGTALPAASTTNVR